MNAKAWASRHHLALVIAAIAVVGACSVVAGSTLSFVNFAAIADEHGESAAIYLEETGFPRATGATVETYQFIGVGPENDVATFRVDWAAGTVEAIQAEEGDADAVARFPPGAYDKVLAKWEAYSHGQSIALDDRLQLAGEILTGSKVDVRERGPLGDFAWKTQLVLWASGRVIEATHNGELRMA